MRLKFLALSGCVALASCATKPDDIAPAYVSSYAYEGMSCQRLSQEAEQVSVRAVAATGAQEKKRGQDAALTTAAIVVFWPAAFFVGGDGQQAAEVARLKGEMQAIEDVNRRKNCGIRFQA